MAVEFYSPPVRGAAFSTRGAGLIEVKFPQARKAIRIGSHKKPSGPDRDALRNDARPRLRAIAFHASGWCEQMVGQYVRGEVGVYRGTAAARANVDAYGQLGNQTLQTSSARAALSVGSDVAGVTVFSASERERILFQQQTALPGTTFVDTIVPNGTYGGGPLWPMNVSNSATCTACAQRAGHARLAGARGGCGQRQRRRSARCHGVRQPAARVALRAHLRTDQPAN